MWIVVVPPPIPKFQKLDGFRPLYFGGALFSGFFKTFFLWQASEPLLDSGQAMPLAGPWCPWQAHGASDWCPCQAGDAPGRPVVSLTSMWCPLEVMYVAPLLSLSSSSSSTSLSTCGAPDKPVAPLTGLWRTGAPGRDCGAPDNSVIPLAGLWCPC